MHQSKSFTHHSTAFCRTLIREFARNLEGDEHAEAVDGVHADDGHGEAGGHHERSTKAIVAEVILQIIFLLFLLLTYRTFKKNK